MDDQERDNVFQLQGLSNDLVEENKKLTQSTSQLNFLMEKLKKDQRAYLQEAAEEQKSFQEEVIKRLDAASKQISENAYEAFEDRSLKESNDAIKNLKELSYRASAQVAEASKKTKFCFKKLSGLIIAGSIVGGVIGGGVGGFMMRYFPKIDDYVEERYEWGRALDRSWAELSKAEQKKLRKLLTKNSG